MRTNAGLEYWIGEDRSGHTVPIFHVAPTAGGHTPELRRATGILVPIEGQASSLGRLLGRQRLTAAHHGYADLTAPNHLAQAVDAPLRHVPAGMRVDEALHIAEIEPIGDRSRRVGGSAEGAFEAPARIGE